MKRADIMAVAISMAIGLLLAVLPHLACAMAYGSPVHLADGDEVYYLAVARAPYYGQMTLPDIMARPEEGFPSLYTWYPYVPGAVLAKWMGLPLIYVGFLWRAIGGASFGAVLYVMFRCLFQNWDSGRIAAFICTLVCLADSGLVTGRPLIDNGRMLLDASKGLTQGRLGDGSLPQYRITTPLTVLPFVLVLAGLVAAAPRGWLAILAGCILLAVTIYAYFFFWTALVAALFGYGLASFLYGMAVPSARTESFRLGRFCAMVLAGGLTLGAPQILRNSNQFSNPAFKPALERTSRGMKVPPGDPARTMYLVNRWFMLEAAIATLALLWLRRRELGWLLCLTVAGFTLRNSAIITGLEFENFHWSYIHAPFGEIALLAAIGYAIQDFPRWQKAALVTSGVYITFLLISGGYLRVFQTFNASEPIYYRSAVASLDSLRPALTELSPNDRLAGPKETNVAFLIAPFWQLFHYGGTNGTLIPDHEVIERYTLNAWLQGRPIQAFEWPNEEDRFCAGVVRRPEWEQKEVHRRIAKLWAELESGGSPQLMARYRPTHLLLPAGDHPPSGNTGPWQLVASTETLCLWSRKTE